jgi:hypothetical protein
MGLEKKEISLIPYITIKIRRECHSQGVYEYMDPRFLQILEKEYFFSSGISSFAIPWLRFMQDTPHNYCVLHPDRLSRFQSTVKDDDNDGDALFVDFETLANVIYLCGMYSISRDDNNNDKFHSLWSGDVDKLSAEKNLLLEIYRMKTTRFPKARMYFYHAERNMWKTACARHNIPLTDPMARLFDDAIDLCTVLRSCGILIRDVPNYKLKSVGKGLYKLGFITVDFPSDSSIENGENSMMIARQLYNDTTTHSSSSIHISDDQDPFIESNDARKSLWVYNRYDCQVLYAIQDWLMKL